MARSVATRAAVKKAAATTAPGDKLAAWAADCRLFAREVCHNEPDLWQDDFYAAFSMIQVPGRQPVHKKLAVKASKGPGKSRALGVVGWWWLWSRWQPTMVIMSITADNLRDNLWTEMAKIQYNSPLLTEFFTMSTERIVAKKQEAYWWASARSFPQEADKDKQANTLAGLHGEFPCVLCDEAGDYPDGVIVAAEAIFSAKVGSGKNMRPVDARLAVVGNATNENGPLGRIWNRERNQWWTREITGDPLDPERSPRVDLEWAKGEIEKWGRDSDYVKVNILGQFPTQSYNRLISYEDASQAANRHVAEAVIGTAPVVMALDVARKGMCKSVLTRRQGLRCFPQRTWAASSLDSLYLMTLSDQVAEELVKHKPDAFFCDATGVGGGVVDRLRQLGFSVIAVDGGSNAGDAKFRDKRSEMWWRMSQWLKNGGSIPDDNALRSELVVPTFQYRQVNKMTKGVLQSKDDGITGPLDHADSLSMTFGATVWQAPGANAMSLAQALDGRGFKPFAAAEYDPLADLGVPERG